MIYWKIDVELSKKVNFVILRVDFSENPSEYSFIIMR